MKQCMKYSIIVILAALLHNGATDAAEFFCTSCLRNKSEHCTLSQAPTARQSILNFYNHCSATPLYMECVDNTHLSDNKSYWLLTSLFSFQQHAYSPKCDRLSFLWPHPIPDTHDYVIGLRKMII